MNTQKATYWFALALAAIAFHSEYQRGAFPSLHRAANSAGVTLCRAATKAERTVAMARLIVGRPALSADDLLAAADARQLAEDRADMVREEAQGRAELFRDRVRDKVRERVRDQVRARAEIVRAQTEMQRSQMRKLHVFSQSQVRISNAVDLPVISVTPGRCPQSGVRVEVPSLDLRTDDSSDDDADSQ